MQAFGLVRGSKRSLNGAVFCERGFRAGSQPPARKTSRSKESTPALKKELTIRAPRILSATPTQPEQFRCLGP
jgi:hypothetical protein